MTSSSPLPWLSESEGGFETTSTFLTLAFDRLVLDCFMAAASS